MTSPLSDLYPEVAAGGFSRVDGAIEFYTRVNALLRPDMTVIDYGAGRGLHHENSSEYRRQLLTLRGKVQKVIGVDVDPIVATNPLLDEAIHLPGPTSPVPLPDASANLILSDFTFEHIANPEHTAAEITRLLRPGGWLCARTPNRWGYIGIGGRLVPNRFHTKAVHTLQPHGQRGDADVFPTVYAMNTRSALRRLFPADRFEDCSYIRNGEPTYFGGSRPMWRVGKVVLRLLPEPVSTMFFVFMRRKPEA